MKYEFRWVEPGSMEKKKPDNKTRRRVYSDPTADAAIGRVMREEKQRKKKAEEQGRAEKEKEEKGKMAEGQGRAGKDKKE